METYFLLGPAGFGKTFRCVTEIRKALIADPAGPPLVFVVPKQATFQIERQVLEDPKLSGYTRLHIVSFERLAEIVLGALNRPPTGFLNNEGRVMVLRALLSRERPDLKLFRASARLPNFAQQLSHLLSELQHHGVSARRLESLACQAGQSLELNLKLHDLGVLLDSYQTWLRDQKLEDGDCLLRRAADALDQETAKYRMVEMEAKVAAANRNQDDPAMKTSSRAAAVAEGSGRFRIEGLWLDGFAEITPQELDLLAALAPFCERMTLAFCCDPEFDAGQSTFSIWTPVSQTYQKCYQRLGHLPGRKSDIIRLKRDEVTENRFARNPVLALLEKRWGEPKSLEGAKVPSQSPAAPAISCSSGLRIVCCPNAEGEAIAAAREIRAFARAGGRYREAAVLLRSLEGYHEAIRRVFSRYEIPFFLDRREPVAHHPIAVLTRCALRSLALGWSHEDWFGALKTGLVSNEETLIDELENAALAGGWKGGVWGEPLRIKDDPELETRLEGLRRKIVPHFQALAQRLSAESGSTPEAASGLQLADGLRQFWAELKVQEQLEQWTLDSSNLVHRTVWEEMGLWLDNLELAFANEVLSWRAWVSIVETGLTGLTVGVIPPALDRVLVGAIDRSRNPELKLTVVLGLNEGVFPKPPDPDVLLTESDRQALEDRQVFLGPRTRLSLARERFLGYIACTRSRERLVLTYSALDAEGRPLNRSPFIARVQQLVPSAEPETFSTDIDWSEAEHASELIPFLVRCRSDGLLEKLAAPALDSVFRQIHAFPSLRDQATITPELAGALYGPILTSSVSRLEDYAACPFKFFVSAGLKAEERKMFQFDARERGSFQHHVLEYFHKSLVDEGKDWRDLTPVEARQRIVRISARIAADYRDGLPQAGEGSRFKTQTLTVSLQNLVEKLIEWMEHYQFDPRVVEIQFGGEQPGLPAWELDLGNGRRLALKGKIDRIDVAPGQNPDEAYCLVIDYKSSNKQLDALLMRHGIQLQLVAYLSVLRRLEGAKTTFNFERLMPAGATYVNLKGSYKGGASRKEVLGGIEDARRSAYQHRGRFDERILKKLDQSCDSEGSGQFDIRLTKTGKVHGNCRDILDSESFNELLDETEKILIRMGREIFQGTVKIDPYRKNGITACGICPYRPICRIDPWSHEYRVLRAEKRDQPG